jgi:hypothetical protein
VCGDTLLAAGTFHYGGYHRWAPVPHGVSGSLWMGPGLGTAWRMTRQPGAFLGASLPLLVFSLALGGGWLALRLLARPKGGLLFLVNAAFYAAILPALACLTDALAAQLKVPSRWERHEKHE